MSQASSSSDLPTCDHTHTLRLTTNRPEDGIEVAYDTPSGTHNYTVEHSDLDDGDVVEFRVCVTCHRMLDMPKIPVELMAHSLQQKVLTSSVDCRKCAMTIYNDGQYTDSTTVDGLCGACVLEEALEGLENESDSDDNSVMSE